VKTESEANGSLFRDAIAAAAAAATAAPAAAVATAAAEGAAAAAALAGSATRRSSHRIQVLRFSKSPAQHACEINSLQLFLPEPCESDIFHHDNEGQ